MNAILNYWKIDTAGNQLPYADQIVFSIIGDEQVILLKFINGEIDLFGRYSDVNMFHTLKLEEKKGKFKIVISGPNSGPSFYLNWDVENPGLREAFRTNRCASPFRMSSTGKKSIKSCTKDF
jgi:peptide/nickel transport system substrate-binding protein